MAQSIPQDDSILFPDDTIVLVFDDAIAVGSGNITISDGTDIHIIDVTDDSQVHLSPFDNNIVIDVNEDLLVDHTYHLTIDAGAILDTAGNTFAGIQGNSALTFVVADHYIIDDLFPITIANSQLIEMVGTTDTSLPSSVGMVG